MDTGADTGSSTDCGLLPHVVVWLYPGAAADFLGCDIPIGAVFAVPYQEDRDMDNTVAAPAASSSNPVPAPAQPEPAKEAVVEKVVDDAAKVEAPKAEASTVQPAEPVVPFDPMAVAQDNPMLAMGLALLAVVGGGAGFKLWTKMSEQKHEQKMKMLELESQKSGLNGAQPPPCQTAQAQVEARLAALESRVVKAEKASMAMPDGFDPEELESRMGKLEAAVKRLTPKAKP